MAVKDGMGSSGQDSVQAGTIWIRYVLGKYIFWKYSGSVTDWGRAGIYKNVTCMSLTWGPTDLLDVSGIGVGTREASF